MHDNYQVILFMSDPKYDKQVFEEDGGNPQTLPVPAFSPKLIAFCRDLIMLFNILSRTWDLQRKKSEIRDDE
jgi:hypothetical protein